MSESMSTKRGYNFCKGSNHIIKITLMIMRLLLHVYRQYLLRHSKTERNIHKHSELSVSSVKIYYILRTELEFFFLFDYSANKHEHHYKEGPLQWTSIKTSCDWLPIKMITFKRGTCLLSTHAIQLMEVFSAQVLSESKIVCGYRLKKRHWMDSSFTKLITKTEGGNKHVCGIMLTTVAGIQYSNGHLCTLQGKKRHTAVGSAFTKHNVI